MSNAEIYADDMDEGGFEAENAAKAWADVDAGLTPAEVLAKIEGVVVDFVEVLASGSVTELLLVSRSASNVQLFARGGPQQPQQQGDTQQLIAGLGDRTVRKSLLANQGAGAFSYVRTFLLLAEVHKLLRSGETTTQRDLYYKLLADTRLFNNDREFNAAIQDVVALLRVPRSSLGIVCAGRGSVSGRLLLRKGPLAPWHDCAACDGDDNAGFAISGDIAAMASMSFQCTEARYLIVVEKVSRTHLDAERGQALPAAYVRPVTMMAVEQMSLKSGSPSACCPASLGWLAGQRRRP